MSNVEEVTAERGSTYGPFIENAPHAMRIMRAFDSLPNAFESGDDRYDDCLRYALWMIATKVSRLACSPMHRDSVLDIGGYSKILLEALDESVMEEEVPR